VDEKGEKKYLKEILESLKKRERIQILAVSNGRVVGNGAMSIHVYEKFGFKECGRIPKSLFYKGEYVDEIVMVKTFDL
jgi:L-amino acid N-acyltransferase YncA